MVQESRYRGVVLNVERYGMFFLFNSKRKNHLPTYEKLPTESKYFHGKLFRKMVDDLRLAGKAKRTVYGYLRAVQKLTDFCETAPDQLDEQAVREYLLHLIVEREVAMVATGTQTVALSGIKFFYRQTCPRDWKVLTDTKLRYASALPKVITRPLVETATNF
jgi:hypothetical protein